MLKINGHLIQISSRINGTVIKINVDENQYVGKGTVIAELDPADYQSRSRMLRRLSPALSKCGCRDRERTDHFDQYGQHTSVRRI